MKSEDIDNRFTHHPPSSEQVVMYGALRSTARSLAHLINDECPESREKSLAITKLQEAVMWANASIACNKSKIGNSDDRR